jgi:hypothetical protein
MSQLDDYLYFPDNKLMIIVIPKSTACATQVVAQANSLTLAFLHTAVGQISGHHHHFSMLHMMELHCYRSRANPRVVRDGTGK